MSDGAATLLLLGSLPERFRSKVRVVESGCWEWTAFKTKQGYGFYAAGNQKTPRTVRAHRYSYEFLVGPIPDGLTIDHLCRNRGCVNPAHLEPVTVRENVLRGDGITARFARQTHCKRGHEFTPENTRITVSGRRECCKCKRVSNKRWAANNRKRKRELERERFA